MKIIPRGRSIRISDARLAWVLSGLLTLALIWLAIPGLAQQAPEGRSPAQPELTPESQEGFYDVDQLERLFRIARDSGFTDEDIRQITIEDEQGKSINAWEYLQEIKRRRELRSKVDQDKLLRIYVTVQDILSDLKSEERADLRKLRDETVFPD